MSAAATWRAARAEAVRTGGARGLLARVVGPLGFALPLVITLIVAAVFERLATSGGLLEVQQVKTANAVYWIIALGVTVTTVAAAFAQADVGRGPAGEVARHALPGPGPDMLGRLLVFGAAAALAAVMAVFLALITLPVVFPGVYGEVYLGSAAGLRFLWAVPLYAFLAAALGTGVGALITRPAGAVTVVALWSLLVEPAVVMLPRGGRLVGWMPFLNGTYGTGQDVALDPPWGPGGALAYFAAVTALVFAAGWLRRRRAEVR